MKQHLVHIVKPSFRSLLFFLAAGMFLFSCKEDIKLSSEASVTSLTLTIASTDYAITFTNKQGKITLPYGTELPATATVKAVQLSARATGIKVGDDIAIPVSGTVTLTVTAEDDKTTGVYTITVKKEEPSSEASITALTLTIASADYKVTFAGKQGKITLPYTTELPVTATVKAVVLSAKATGVKVGDSVTIPVSGTVTLTVTAEDGTTESDYTVTFSVAASSEASVTSLTLTVGDTDYEIMFEDRQDTITLPYGTAIPTEVEVKEIVLSAGAASDAGTELTVSDNAVTITVTAEDGETKQDYTVTLVVSQVAAPLFTSFTFEVTDNENMALDEADRQRIEGTINQQDNTITFPDQSAYVYLNRLKASFTTSAGATVQVGGADQVSGVTEQDFSSPVSYVVRTQDGTETTYTVTLTKSTLATIPDASFRAKLQELFPAAFTEDQLNITHSDVVNNSGALDVNTQTPKLTSLKGIEFFTTLKQLYCQANALTSLDVSKNTALTDLNCSTNTLKSLDVSKNTALESLYCYTNSLTSLDVSKNTSLVVLYCYTNALKSLDVRANTALTELYCSNNNLTLLDMTGMRRVAYPGAVSIGTGTGTNNPLLATLKVNTALQDAATIITMKTNRGAALTITTVNNAGTEVCADYTPAEGGGTCNDN